VEQQLWTLAERHTPHTRVADYTQAVMDLGAAICGRTEPLCQACPLHKQCAAHRRGDPLAFPTPAPRREKPSKAVSMVMIRHTNSVLLERRPGTGIWGGLWGFPECAPGTDIPATIQDRYGMIVAPEPCWDPIRHSFTHFQLHITPVPAKLVINGPGVMETADLVWYKPRYPDQRGLAAPVKSLLKKLSKTYGA
jgi:A/G-specific adenine glycosylase